MDRATLRVVLRNTLALAWLPLMACGDPTASGPDAGFGVTVLTPNGGEALIAAEPVELRWRLSAAEALPCDVDLLGADGTKVATIAAGVTASTLAWSPPGVVAATEFRIRVTAHDVDGTAEDSSDAAFTVNPPSVGFSLARDVQPIFTLRCTTRFCHGVESQVALLNLAPGASHGALVDVVSATAACHTFVRVRPALPDQSYLIWKLAGGGACLSGGRMPKDAPALTAAELTSIRTWIAEGAKPN